MQFYKHKVTGEMVPGDAFLSEETKADYDIVYDYHLRELMQLNQRVGWILFILVLQVIGAAIAAYAIYF